MSRYLAYALSINLLTMRPDFWIRKCSVNITDPHMYVLSLVTSFKNCIFSLGETLKGTLFQETPINRAEFM